jgi:hypothetical protein
MTTEETSGCETGAGRQETQLLDCYVMMMTVVYKGRSANG